MRKRERGLSGGFVLAHCARNLERSERFFLPFVLGEKKVRALLKYEWRAGKKCGSTTLACAFVFGWVLSGGRGKQNIALGD
jgi:hypothetical protein